MSIKNQQRPPAARKTLRLFVSMFAALSLSLTAIACGIVTEETDAGVVPPDAQLIPDARPSPDAMVPPPPDTAEVVSAGGQVSGGGYTADVQVGHWNGQGAFNGGAYSGHGAAAIKR